MVDVVDRWPQRPPGMSMRFGPPAGATYQAFQTRARLTFHLYMQIALSVALLWIAFTVIVVRWETASYFPQLGQQYWWRWVLCSLLSPFQQWARIPANGAWYPMPQFAAWLDGPQLYNASFAAWFEHYAWRTALIPLGLGVFAIVWKLRHRIDVEHLRGLRLLSPREHNRQLNGGVLYRSAQRALKQGPMGIKIGTSVIPPLKEFEHFEITGSPGAGKSTLIRDMLYQVQERGQSAIVPDIDSEFVQEFYDEARGDVVLNPLDARCPFWSPWLEFRDESFTMDAEAMAASLIRGQARTPTEEFFLDSARTLLESIFTVIGDRSDPRALINFLSQPRVSIHQALQGTRAYALVDPGAHEQSTGIVATATNAVKAFYHLPTRDEAKGVWSAREWAQERRGWIFMPSSEDARAAIQTLQGVWLDALTRWLMAADIGSEQVWIVVDELPAMGYQSQIEQLLTRGRKRGLSVVVGFQNVSQLRAIYGRDRTVTMTSAPTTKVILRCDEAETAKWASELLGAREVERLQMTQLAGLSTMREGVNLQPQRAVEHIVTTAEIQLLKELQGYLCVAGCDRTTVAIPRRHLQKNKPAFVPRTAAAERPDATYDAC